MSFSFYIYRGPEGLPAVIKWPHMLSDGLGPAVEIRAVLSGLLPSIEWIRQKDGHSFGQGVDPHYKGSFFIWLHENDASLVFLISTSNHASPHTLTLVMERLALNYCCTSFGDFRQPDMCDNQWNRIK